MNNTMISVNGFAKREYEDALEKKGVIPANVVILSLIHISEPTRP